ncbi:hypothetical protein FOA52_001158 [Chlamydomonas sp. UWO 241]|nr:hypothetical protein FOA52_001158 [Chlamydomonas sp. UWO 241]
MVPFIATFLDFDSSEETYKRYDRMSAYELFKMCGVSTAAYEEFLKPTLLVGLFAPPEQISAASMLETLYFYALAHQNDFDVCWCKGSIAERIFQPLISRIEGAGGNVVGNRLVTGLDTGADGEVTQVRALDRSTGLEVVYPADAVVFAIGITGMQKLVTAVPALAAAQEFRAVMNLKSIDVIATRLWLDKKVETKYPANVLSGFEPEAQAGATYFHLNDLQDEYADLDVSVITADFYNASALLPLTDAEIVARIKGHLETCEPAFKGTNVVDSAVLRFPKAVTHFSPGSYPNRPYQITSLPNVFLAGDWVKGVQHGANGLSQVRQRRRL